MDLSKRTRPILLTRRQAIWSLAAFAAGAFINPTIALSSNPVKQSIRFAILGDWGTGCDDGQGIAAQMLETHKRMPFDFIVCAGDNIYPDGGARHFAKNFEQPFSTFLK